MARTRQKKKNPLAGHPSRPQASFLLQYSVAFRVPVSERQVKTVATAQRASTGFGKLKVFKVSVMWA